MMETFIGDYLDIIHDIELRDVDLNKFIGWLYKKTYYKYYRKKLIQSLDKMDNMILFKDNVQELIYYIANTFSSDNGKFLSIIEAKTHTFGSGSTREYTMYSAIVKVGQSTAEIKTYSNQKNMQVYYHTNIVDIKNNSSSFTMIGELLKVEDNSSIAAHKAESIAQLNSTLIQVTKDYILYCMDNYKGE